MQPGHVPQLDVMIGAIGPGDEWLQMAGVVRVPEGVGFIVALLSGTGQRSEDDATWYHELAVFRIDCWQDTRGDGFSWCEHGSPSQHSA